MSLLIFAVSSTLECFYWIVFLFLAVLGFRRCMDPSLVVASRGCSPVAVQFSHYGGFSCCGAQALEHVGFHSVSRTQEHRLNSVGHGLSCTEVCGIFPDQGLNPYLPHWQADFLPQSTQGRLTLEYFFYYLTFCSLFCLVYILSFWKFYYIDYIIYFLTWIFIYFSTLFKTWYIMEGWLSFSLLISFSVVPFYF